MNTRKRSPTILDVAKAAGVSGATVSRVVNGDAKVAPGTRRAVQAAIERLGYRHNALARSLVTGRSGVLGVVVPDVAGPLYAQMARGIEDVLEPRGMTFTLVTSDRDGEREARLITLLLSRKVDGLVLIGSQLAEARLERLLADGPAAILVQREAEGELRRYGVFGLDNAQGSRQALTHLHDRGHRRIAHVSGLRRDGAERLQAYLAFMRERGLAPCVVESDSSEAGGQRALEPLLAQEGISAVYCCNDRVALGLYHALRQRGGRVGEDLSLIGFDDLPWCAYLDPPLTTVRQDGREMGRAAAREVLAQLAGARAPQRHTLPTQLVVRASVRDVRAPAQKGGTAL